jgi:HlyD family secretion protein
MEARVDVGEIDVVLVQIGQKAQLEVDSFRDRKFNGVVTEIANAARTQGLNTQQEATKFEVRIRVQEKEIFRPGMSVTAEVETRYRTNVVSVPLQSVTTRLPKEAKEQLEKQKKQATESKEEEEAGSSPDDAAGRRRAAKGNAPKPIEVVFAVKDGKCVLKPVTRGISDDTYVRDPRRGRRGPGGRSSAATRPSTKELEDGKAVTRLTNKPGFKLLGQGATP